MLEEVARLRWQPAPLPNSLNVCPPPRWRDLPDPPMLRQRCYVMSARILSPTERSLFTTVRLTRTGNDTTFSLGIDL